MKKLSDDLISESVLKIGSVNEVKNRSLLLVKKLLSSLVKSAL